MKVSMIDPSGGVLHYDLVLAEELRRLIDIELVTSLYGKSSICGNSSTFVKDLFLRSSLKRKLGPFGKPFKFCEYLADNLRFLMHMRQQNPDIIHYQWTPVPIFDSLAMEFLRQNTKARIIYTAHNVLPHSRRKYHKYLFSKVYTKADGIIVHSENIKKELLSEFSLPEEKVDVIGHPVFTYFDKNIFTKKIAKDELGINAEDKVVLFWGNIEEYKGLDLLLTAFRAVADKRDDVMLVIAGKCGDFSRYYDIIREKGIGARILKHIKFLPEKMVECVFKASDLLVLPYRKVYGSGVLMAGLSFEIPMIVTDTGHFPEMVKDGVNGYVVDAGDEKGLSEAILRFFSQSSRDVFRMKNAMSGIKEKFMPKNIAERTVRYYERVLER